MNNIVKKIKDLLEKDKKELNQNIDCYVKSKSAIEKGIIKNIINELKIRIDTYEIILYKRKRG